MFRIGGNINLDNSEVVQGQKFKLTIGQKKNTLSFIQYLQALSPENPYFSVTITNTSNNLFISLIFNRFEICNAFKF